MIKNIKKNKTNNIHDKSDLNFPFVINIYIDVISKTNKKYLIKIDLTKVVILNETVKGRGQSFKIYFRDVTKNLIV